MTQASRSIPRSYSVTEIGLSIFALGLAFGFLAQTWESRIRKADLRSLDARIQRIESMIEKRTPDPATRPGDKAPAVHPSQRAPSVEAEEGGPFV